VAFPKHTVRVNWLAWLVLGLVLSGCSADVKHEALPAGATVLVFGDSITFGTGAGVYEDFPSLMAKDTGWNVINAGIPGDTAIDARHRLEALLAEHQPRLVIVELGGNDFLRKKRTDRVQEALRSIIQQAQAAGAVVVLVAVPELSLLRASIGALQDSSIYEVLAQEEGVLLAADILAEVLSDESLIADPIHPNAAGYRQFNEALLALLRDWGLLL
jgi:acyl-CoA thioesterase I